MKRIFPSHDHEALVDSFGRADAATAERGGAHRGKDSQPGQECQPTLLERRASLGCPPRRRQTDLLVNESAPSAAAARGLHKGRHRLMTAERRVPSMYCAVGSPPYGRGSTPMTPWTGGLPSQPAFVRPQAEGEQPQARGTITMRRPSAGQHADGEDSSIIY